VGGYATCERGVVVYIEFEEVKEFVGERYGAVLRAGDEVVEG
jgi:hypothetical protein